MIGDGFASLAVVGVGVIRQTVTWVKLEKPQFDLLGVLLSSLGITVGLIAIALLVGSVIGLLRVRRARSQPQSALDQVSLHLNHSS